MYGQTQHYQHTADHTRCTFTADAVPAAYKVHVAGVKMDVWLDSMADMDISGVPMRMPGTYNPLRAALPSSVADLSPADHSAQPVWRAPSIKTGHSSFLAVLDQIGARHRTVSGGEVLQAAFGATGK
ncbi:hypothetical protein [Kordiimonas aquimaris]|uniref:hypothetical protein n=1 Tax=Kordiimonas aquimaris TaxID=707591 RepID=UPI0021CF4007|nr:hypothetical protein [Kordiimonas aquimaris]